MSVDHAHRFLSDFTPILCTLKRGAGEVPLSDIAPGGNTLRCAPPKIRVEVSYTHAFKAVRFCFAGAQKGERGNYQTGTANWFAVRI